MIADSKRKKLGELNVQLQGMRQSDKQLAMHDSTGCCGTMTTVVQGAAAATLQH